MTPYLERIDSVEATRPCPRSLFLSFFEIEQMSMYYSCHCSVRATRLD